MTAATARRRPAVSDNDKLQRRDEIMAAAKKVFARNGFHATTIADVAKEASLPFDAVYQYFDSRDALFHALDRRRGVCPAHPRRGRAGRERRTVRVRRGAVSRHIAGDIRVL